MNQDAQDRFEAAKALIENRQPGDSSAKTGEKVDVYVGILDSAITLLINPALGLGDVGKIVALLGFAGNVVRDIAAGAGELHDLNEHIKALVREGRGPTADEWAAVNAMILSNRAGFAEVKATL